MSFFYNKWFTIELFVCLIHIYDTYRNASPKAAGLSRISAGFPSFLVTDPEGLEKLQSEIS